MFGMLPPPLSSKLIFIERLRAHRGETLHTTTFG
jgi:hypothetical protein